MPQLDVSTFSSQIFWLIICFSVLYYLLSRKALPRISETLEARQDRIAADLDQAQRLRREAETALASYGAMAEAQGRAQALLGEAQSRLQAEAATRQAELDQQLAGQLAEAEARIGAARDRARRARGCGDRRGGRRPPGWRASRCPRMARHALRAVRQEAA